MALFSAAYGYYNADGRNTPIQSYVRVIDNYGETNNRTAFCADEEGQRSHFPVDEYPPSLGKSIPTAVIFGPTLIRRSSDNQLIELRIISLPHS